MALRSSLLALLPAMGLLAACPARVSHEPPPEEDPAVEVAKLEKDERVVEFGGDYYQAEEFDPPEQQQAGRAPGSGLPDESNGLCRLYAPKLPEPECCKQEYGFDVETVRKACGLGVYLGESYHMSCGYHFHKDGRPTWLRMSFLPGKDPRAAADAHVEKLRRVLEQPSIDYRRVPGAPGAYWSSHDGLNWAFLPGWSAVRQLTWRDQTCDRDGIVRVIRQLLRAKQPPEDAERLGLVPKART